MNRTPEYEALPALSYSGIKELLRSPAHYQHHLKAPRVETKALRLGTAAHCAFLTPDIWAATYKAVPECDRRTKEGKAVHEAFMASLKPGDVALAFDEYELATELAQSASRIADNLIYRTGAWVERPLTGYDRKTPIKGIPDLIDSDGWIYDLKTCEDASDRVFTRAALTFGYHIQAAHYIRLAHCHRTDIRGFRIIAIEKDAPHLGAVYEITGDLLEHGRKECERAYSLYDKCVADGVWPGYAESGTVITLSDLPWKKADASAAGMKMTF